nr:uncharacterized protein LOC111503137 [Leptinotarsa decemlineata]
MAKSNYWKTPLTTADLLDEIERLDEDDPNIPDDIYITPPDDNDFESAEDSGDEDCNDPNRLNPRQLQAEAESNKLEEDNSDNEKKTQLQEESGLSRKNKFSEKRNR